jgi:hypothetical protein
MVHDGARTKVCMLRLCIPEGTSSLSTSAANPQAAQPASPSIRMDARMLRAFLKLRPRRVDLLHDMGEEELFWIDGESLLYEACCVQRLSTRQPLQVNSANRALIG